MSLVLFRVFVVVVFVCLCIPNTYFGIIGCCGGFHSFRTFHFVCSVFSIIYLVYCFLGGFSYPC